MVYKGDESEPYRWGEAEVPAGQKSRSMEDGPG